MPPAIIAAGIGAAASIGGGLMASSAQNKASKRAAQTAQNTANSNNALTQGIYNQNTSNLRPFMESGTRANALLDNLLYGYQGGPQQPQQGQQPFGGQQPNALARQPRMVGEAFTDDEMQGYQNGSPTQGAFAPQGQPNAGMNAWDAFRNSTNYQFRLGEGMNALNSGWAGQGALQSGAAAKDAIRYGQNFASNELGQWMNMLGGQQNLGLSGASALAGVGQNMVNNVTANNNSASSAAANAALMNGQNQANMYGGIANSLGTFAGSFGSSFGKPGGKPGGQSNGYTLPPPGPWYQGY